MRERGGSGRARPDRIYSAPSGRAEGRLVRRQLPVGARRFRELGDAGSGRHGATPDRQLDAAALRVAGRTNVRRRCSHRHDGRGPVAARLRSGSELTQQPGIVSVPSSVPIIYTYYIHI